MNTRATTAPASESSAMAPSKLIMSVQDGVLTLSLNRPEKLNAIDNDLSRDLLSALATASSDPSVRVVVVNGNGSAFCAGRDISTAPTDEDLVLVQAVSMAIVDLTKPLIAAVHGWTVGAGLGLGAVVACRGAGPARFGVATCGPSDRRAATGSGESVQAGA